MNDPCCNPSIRATPKATFGPPGPRGPRGLDGPPGPPGPIGPSGNEGQSFALDVADEATESLSLSLQGLGLTDGSGIAIVDVSGPGIGNYELRLETEGNGNAITSLDGRITGQPTPPFWTATAELVGGSVRVSVTNETGADDVFTIKVASSYDTF